MRFLYAQRNHGFAVSSHDCPAVDSLPRVSHADFIRAQRARIAAVSPRYNPVPVIRLSFTLRAAIFAGIGMASAAGVGSILGFLLGAL